MPDLRTKLEALILKWHDRSGHTPKWAGGWAILACAQELEATLRSQSDQPDPFSSAEIERAAKGDGA